MPWVRGCAGARVRGCERVARATWRGAHGTSDTGPQTCHACKTATEDFCEACRSFSRGDWISFACTMLNHSWRVSHRVDRLADFGLLGACNHSTASLQSGPSNATAHPFMTLETRDEPGEARHGVRILVNHVLFNFSAFACDQQDKYLLSHERPGCLSQPQTPARRPRCQGVKS